jgi:hypothetical protein
MSLKIAEIAFQQRCLQMSSLNFNFPVRNSPKTFMLDDFHYVGNLNGEDKQRHPSSSPRQIPQYKA